MDSPKAAITSGSSQRMSFGPAIATEGAISTAPRRRSKASTAGALSCESSQSHSSSDWAGPTAFIDWARAEPRLERGFALTNCVGEAAVSRSTLLSVEPMSTTTRESGRRVWAASPSRVRPKYCAPFRATSIAVTLACI